MAAQPKKDTAVRILKLLSLLLLIFFAVLLFLLLFTLVPMAILDGNVQIDSGGFLDYLLQRTQHASAVIAAPLVFLGALPLLLDTLLLLADSIVLYSFMKQVKKRGTWYYAAGKTRWIIASVLGALIAAVPAITSACVKSAVAASGTFAVRPWNPTGGILLFALTLAVTILYIIKTNRRLRAPEAAIDETPEPTNTAETTEGEEA